MRVVFNVFLGPRDPPEDQGTKGPRDQGTKGEDWRKGRFKDKKI